MSDYQVERSRQSDAEDQAERYRSPPTDLGPVAYLNMPSQGYSFSTTIAASIVGNARTPQAVTPASMDRIVGGLTGFIQTATGSPQESFTIVSTTATTFSAIFRASQTGPGIVIFIFLPGEVGDDTAPLVMQATYPSDTKRFPLAVVGAPPVFIGASNARNNLAALIDGRWTAQTLYCPCGPCHPQRTIRLKIDFLQATRVQPAGFGSSPTWTTARQSATFGMAWGDTSNPNYGDRTHLDPYSWFTTWDYNYYGNAVSRAYLDSINPFYRQTNVGGYLGTVNVGYPGGLPGDQHYRQEPIWQGGTTTFTGFGVGGTGVFTSPYANGDDDAGYINHYFQLACKDSGYTLIHTMTNNQYSNRASGLIFSGVGYQMTRRGILRSCKPLKIDFPAIPDSVSSIDARIVPGADFYNSIPEYETFLSGKSRPPKINPDPTGNPLSGQSVGDSYATSSGVVSTTNGYSYQNAATITPPYGVYSITIDES